MAATKYEQVYDGEWTATPCDSLIGCCDCGLVHTIQIRKHRGRFQLRVWRENGITRDNRRVHAKHFSMRKK